MIGFLDLRLGGELSVKDAKIITNLEGLLRDEYTDFVGDLVTINKVDKFQWFLKCTCRNTYDSVIYDSMCRLALLEYNLKSGIKYRFILVDSLFLSKVVRQLLNQYNSRAQITVSSRLKSGLSHHIRLIKKMSFNIIYSLSLWAASRFFNKGNPVGSIVLLGTFFLDKGDLYDHYYPDLERNLSDDIIDKVWFFPTLLLPKYPWGWVGIIRRISQFKKQILLKEGWLTINDYLFALKESLLITNDIRSFPKWRGLDMSTIVEFDLLSDKGSYSICYKILTYISFDRLRKSGVEVNMLFDWFENQTIDRAKYLGARKNYPDIYIKGYLGFVPEGYYVGLSPAKYEKNGGVLPNKLCVVGEAYVGIVRKYIQDLEVDVAPAFRFYSTIKFKRDSCLNRDIILLALPMQMVESKNIISLLLGIKIDKKYKLLIKPHPTQTVKKLIKHIPELRGMDFTVNKLSDIFQSTRLLITSASSVAMEAIVCGIPVVIPGNRSGPTINPLHGIVDKKYWSVCYTGNDINNLLSLEYKDNLVKELDMCFYFHDITQDNVCSMINNR